MTDCTNCLYLAINRPQNGHCYMFEEKLEGCMLNQSDYFEVLNRILADVVKAFQPKEDYKPEDHKLIDIKTRGDNGA